MPIIPQEPPTENNLVRPNTSNAVGLNMQGSVFSPAEHESRATERMPDDRQAPNCILYLFYLRVQTVGRDRWKAKFKA